MPPSGSPPLLHQTKPSGRISWATNGFHLTRNGIDNTVFCDHPKRSYHEPGCHYGHGPFSSATERNYESRPMCVSSLIAAKGPGLCMSEFDCSCWSQSMRIRVLSQLWVPARTYHTTTHAHQGSIAAFRSRSMHIRLQPLLWVPPHMYRDYTTASGTGPGISDYNPHNGSRSIHIGVL